MPDREESRTLLKLLASKVLQAGGSITLSSLSWRKNHAGTFERTEANKGTAGRVWQSAESAAVDMLLHADRDGHDSVVFHGTDGAGVPWRMLKIDCPYLAIVNSTDDKKALLVLDGRIAHLSALLDKTLYSSEEKFDARN